MGEKPKIRLENLFSPHPLHLSVPLVQFCNSPVQYPVVDILLASQLQFQVLQLALAMALLSGNRG